MRERRIKGSAIRLDEVFGIASITQLVAFLQGVPMPDVEPIEVMGERASKHRNSGLDLVDVVGQRSRPNGPARSPQPAGTTCSSTVRQVSARPCSPSASPECFLTSMYPTPSKSQRCTPSPPSISPMRSSPDRLTVTHTTRHQLPALLAGQRMAKPGAISVHTKGAISRRGGGVLFSAAGSTNGCVTARDQPRAAVVLHTARRPVEAPVDTAEI